MSQRNDSANKTSTIINRIKNYNNEKNKIRASSCYPGRRRSSVYNLKYLYCQDVPSHLNVLNLILNKTNHKQDINMIENKIKRIKKLSEINKLNSSTTKKLYEYNILYGYNTNNLIKSYTPKLIQFGSNIKKRSNSKIGDNIQIFTEEEIKELFYQKCKDLDVPIKDELMNRFISFIKEKCINRVINLTDCCLGINSMLVLCDILRQNVEICSRIILTKNNFGDDGIQLLLESLRGNNNIVELNLCSNNLGVLGGIYIFEFLMEQNSIISLDLSSKEGIYRNRLCGEGVKLITKVLKNNFFLEEIDLSSNSIKNEGIKYIANGLVYNKNLQNLNISNNEINEKGILYLESKLISSKLKYLNLSSNPISNNGLISLSNCLSGDKLGELIYLNVTECLITFPAFQQFIKKISKNHKIQTLIFNKNNLSSDKWHLLEDFFKVMTLKSLSFGSCNLGQCISEIAVIFKFSTTIKYLDFSHNQINDENFIEFHGYPKENLALEELDVSCNYISDKSAVKFFKNLSENTNILKLNFFDNHLEIDSASTIIDTLKINHHLSYINLNANRIGLKIMNEIKEQIKNNKSLEKVKYLPKLKNELKELAFNPDEIKYLKNQIGRANIEREYMYKKYLKEGKDLSTKKKDIIKEINNVDNLIENMESQIINTKNKFKNIKDEEIKTKNDFIKKVNDIKDKINDIENELKDIHYTTYNLKHNFHEENELLKNNYDSNYKKDESIRIAILSMNKKLHSLNNEYQKKLEYLEKLKSYSLKK